MLSPAIPIVVFLPNPSDGVVGILVSAVDCRENSIAEFRVIDSRKKFPIAGFQRISREQGADDDGVFLAGIEGAGLDGIRKLASAPGGHVGFVRKPVQAGVPLLLRQGLDVL